MLTPHDVDSRDYRFAFALTNARDVPNDFRFDPGTAPVTGVFLPREDPNWLGRGGSPPRLLLLSGDHLEIVPHPDWSKAGRTRVALAGLEAVEAGGALLLGWMRFYADRVVTVRYNRRTRKPVEDLLHAIRRRLCGVTIGGGGKEPVDDDIDYKFRTALHTEAVGERPLAVWYRPAVESMSRPFLLRFRRVTPGELLALLRDRILMLTDRIEGAHDAYGMVATYAPYHHVRDVSVKETETSRELTVRLTSGRAWRMGVPEESREAAMAFCARLGAAG